MVLLQASVLLTAQGASPDLRTLSVVRFDFDNDVLLGKDNSFTAGWNLQWPWGLKDVWGRGYAKWIGRVPGLGDGGRGGPITRLAVGISQVIITPKDVGNPAPQPNDAPWAGMLGAAMSWSAYDNRRMAALQVYAGCMGPCSAAEPVQKFVHGDLGLGPVPKGWDNQLVNKALFNVNYEYRYKLFADRPARYFTPGRFAHDLSVGSHVGLGNVETLIWGQVEYRFGWGLPLGFTKSPQPPLAPAVPRTWPTRPSRYPPRTRPALPWYRHGLRAPARDGSRRRRRSAHTPCDNRPAPRARPPAP